MRDRLPLLVIPTAALLAILPLLLSGHSCGHDYDVHLLNWLEVSSQWKQGVFFPRWEFTCAWNSGEPRFVFYPPLPWAAGALLSLVLPWAAVANTCVWLTLCACGFAMYRLAREWSSSAAALLASCFYMVHPYLLFTGIERSAYAELLAAAWMPLLLLGVLRPRVTIPGLAVPIALLWLSDAPAAVIGCYSLALVALVRVAWRWAALRQRSEALIAAGKITLGTALGLALAGFYLVPAIVEQRWVHIVMQKVPATSYQHHFLFALTGAPDHDAILRTASFCSVALLMLIAAAAALTVAVHRKEPCNESRRVAFLALLLLTALLSFLLTASSAPLWRAIPALPYLQFPWRFDSMLGAIAAVFLAFALRRLPRRLWMAVPAALAIALLGGALGSHFFHQFCSAARATEAVVAAFRRGDIHDPTDQFTPATSDPLALGHNNPPAWVAAAPNAPALPSGLIHDPATLSARLQFAPASASPAFFIVNLRDYPAWRVTLNGKLVSERPHRDDGLIVVPIPSGASTLRIRYALTPDFVCGWILTVIAVMLTAVAWRLDSSHAEPQTPR